MTAAFFDLDRTLWPCVGEKAFAYNQLAEGRISVGQLLRVLALQLRYDLHLIGSAESVKRRMLSELFSGVPVGPCLEAYDTFFAGRLRQALFPGMLDLVARHRADGDRIVLVSAAIDVVAAPVAAHLAADDCYATALEVRDGVFSGEVTGPIPYGHAKARIVQDYATRHGLDLRRCHAYGDDWEDRHMLGAVGFPTAVNPEPRLRRHARTENWRIQVFKA